MKPIGPAGFWKLASIVNRLRDGMKRRRRMLVIRALRDLLNFVFDYFDEADCAKDDVQATYKDVSSDDDPA